MKDHAQTEPAATLERTLHPYSFTWKASGGPLVRQTLMAYDDDNAAVTAGIMLSGIRLVDHGHPDGRGPNRDAKIVNPPKRS